MKASATETASLNVKQNCLQNLPKDAGLENHWKYSGTPTYLI